MKILIFSILIVSTIHLQANNQLASKDSSIIDSKNNKQNVIERFSSIDTSLNSLKTNELERIFNQTLKVSIENYENENEKESSIEYINLISSVFGAIIGAIIAVLVFVLGKKEERKRELKKSKDFGEQIFELIKHIIKNSEKQRDLIIAYTQSIESKPHTHGEYGRISLGAFERAKSFDTSLVFNSFKALKLPNKTFITYYNSLDFLHGVYTIIDSDYRKHNSEVVTPFSNNFIEIRQKILDTASLYLRECKDKNENIDKFYDFLNNLIGNYYKSKDRPEYIDIHYDFIMIIKSIKNELIKDEYTKYPIVNDLLIFSKRAGDYYKTIVDQAELLRKGISSKIDSINTSINSLKELEEDLNKKYAS